MACALLLNFLLFVSALIYISSTPVTADNARLKRAVPRGREQVAPADQPSDKMKLPPLPQDLPLGDMKDNSLKNDLGSSFKQLGKLDKSKRGGHRIADSPECGPEVKTFCSERLNSNNFLVLDCLQDDERTANKLSEECHHYLWQYKRNLTQNIKFDHASSEACEADLNMITECKSLPEGRGLIIPCLIEHYEEVKAKPCKAFLNKMAGIIFSDHRFMEFFMKDCNDDIEKTKCGRLEPVESEDDSPHLQGKTVSCLNEHRKELASSCKKALLKVAELQSDDYHLDRPLYYACKNDRDMLCPTVVSGDGAVFKCLYKHLGDDRLSTECREKLESRQQLIAEDVKADKSFYEACSSDIEKNNCIRRKSPAADSDIEEDLKRSSILLCLEKAQNDGKQVKSECLQEMFELRSELMQDYKISPELVSACEKEIDKLCDGLEPGGNTIQCLMKEAMASKKDKNSQFSSECYAEIRRLLGIANPGENIRLDRPLQRACGDVVHQACADFQSGHGDIINCLLENLDHEDMTDECEEHLLVFQYFAVRDFRLDFHLFKQCRRDATKLCNSDGFNDPATFEPEEGPLIFSCLHRHWRSEDPKDTKPSRPCIHEMKRVMRERSMRINLMPEVEEACMVDLAELCSSDDEHTEEGGEMECLQMNLDGITSEACKTIVTNFTVEESEDIEIDRALMKACTPMIKRFCKDLLDSDSMPDEVLDCLIEHKNQNDMNEKCAAGIEHHQIISLKDFRFNHKFREACQNSVAKFCKNKRTKFDVVACLSEHVRNDTLMDKPQSIEEKCQRQLKFELLQRGESIALDPDLQRNCEKDIPKFCGNKRNGEGEVVECLRSHQKKLSNNCHRLLFQRERDDAIFGDYTVLHVCKKMIKEYCAIDATEADIMTCLLENKNKNDFDSRCRQVIQRRQIEQAQDYRLDPHLQKACRMDIPKFCSDELAMTNDAGELEGRVIDCLKKKYMTKTKILTKDCEHEIQSRIKEAALDINLSPVIIKTCKTDIKQLCVEEIANIRQMDIKDEDAEDPSYKSFGTGAIVECLKKNLRMIKDQQCKKEVAQMIAESRVDVHVDPILHTTCMKDIMTQCKHAPEGQGRQMACLLDLLDNDPHALSPACLGMLTRRKELWEYAAVVAPAESFSEIFDQISSSPARNYFFAILFTVVGVIFIVGLTCGRVTKRVRAELKNK